MELTIYELLGLIKEGKAPAKIKDGIIIYNFDEKKNDYQDPFSKNWSFLYEKLGKAVDNVNDFLNDTVEIFEEENDEWEDIEEIKQITRSKELYTNFEEISDDAHKIVFAIDDLVISFNQLIKNQKRIIEKLENIDD